MDCINSCIRRGSNATRAKCHVLGDYKAKNQWKKQGILEGFTLFFCVSKLGGSTRLHSLRHNKFLLEKARSTTQKSKKNLTRPSLTLPSDSVEPQRSWGTEASTLSQYTPWGLFTAMSHSSSYTTWVLDRAKRLDLEEADMALLSSRFLDMGGSGGESGTG